ncbi:MAG: hypothetical protein M1831_005845 [Alyxoria varia]|nr:MAG: hypothetical protein M1831_005845 [Alyxoria varia]
MFEAKRRSVLQALNSRYIYGKVPLLHAVIFLIEMAAVSLLIQKFNSAVEKKPILTTMMTNAILGGIADTTAQTLVSLRRKHHRKLVSQDNKDGASIEVHELDRKVPLPTTDLNPDHRPLPPPFDFERLTRFMSFGFLMAPLQFKWFGFLTSVFPITSTAGTIPALKRVAFDQLIFAPIGLAFFFTFMTLAEGGGRRAVMKKFEDVYLPSLKANYLLWPAVQVINFRLMPLQFQIPFVSTVGIAWTAYLSLTNSSDDDEV